jgi:16S rRNA C967 or C1407 C5-methylase (RsmB/RsmF family)
MAKTHVHKFTSGRKKKPNFGTDSRDRDSARERDEYDDSNRGKFRIQKSSAASIRAKQTEEEPKPKAKTGAVVKAFTEMWTHLFSSPVHLDSALSKQSASVKSILAQILPSILLRPASLAEALGIGVQAGEPWSLDQNQLGQWRPALLMSERIYEMMVQGPPQVDPVRDDFPAAMVDEWQATWGTETLHELVDTLGREAPLSLRASRKFGPQAVLAGLSVNGKLPVRAELSNLVPLGVRLSGYAPVLGTELYDQGAFEIQDEGSQFMALFALWPERYGALLKDHPGKVKKLDLPAPPPPKDTLAWTVIDTCAGAGGKTLALSDALKGKGRVYAYDTSKIKLQALRRRATRAGLNNIQAVQVVEGNESDVVKRFRSTAQVVLVDAPCSGWGVLRRNPDIKWRQGSDVLTRMPLIQSRLLSEYSHLVAPGGRLVFGVCTFRKAETVDVVREFLKNHPEFKAQDGGFLGPGPCDGFFMQSFIKVE